MRLGIETVLIGLSWLGYCCLLVGAINWLHGLGIRYKWLDKLSLVLLGAGCIGMLAVVARGAGVRVTEWPLGYGLLVAAGAFVPLAYLPGVSLRRVLRGVPKGILAGRTVELSVAGDGSGELWESWLLRVPGNESLSVELTSFDVERGKETGIEERFRIMHLSDLHFSRVYDRSFFEGLVDRLMEEAGEPDLVLFGGDLIDDPECYEWIVPVLGRLKSELGKFAVLGNHDLWFDEVRIRGELEAAGFEVLDGVWREVRREDLCLSIGGTWEPWGRSLLKASPAVGGSCSIVLSHSPDVFPKAVKWGADLVLAGHNHGGQVRLPFVGPVLMPSKYGRRYEAGFYESDGTLLYVSRGVGGKHPIRYLCRPEVTELSIRLNGGGLAVPEDREAQSRGFPLVAPYHRSA